MKKHKHNIHLNLSQSSSRNDNPDIIDVEYKVVDEEKTGDDN